MSQTAQYEMKDSGVEWIGEIPKEWKLKSAKHCVDIHHGSDPTTEGDIPVYGSGAESFKTCGEYKEGPTVLIGRKGATLHIPHYITGKYWNVDTAFDVKAHSDFSLKFYYYLAICFDYKFYISQTTLPGMTQTNYCNMPIPVPLLIEQQSIASYLDEKCAAIDEIIAEAKATIDEYKSWKASVIFEAVTKGLDKNADMKDSGVEWIGRIPKHWRITRTKFCCSKIGSGKTPKGGAEIYADSGIMFLRSQNIYPEGLRLDNVSYITQEIDEEMSSTQVFADDVLLNITGGSIGRCCIYPQDLPHANVNQHVCIIRVHNNIIMPKLMCYMWMSDVGQKTIDMSQTGANREGMNFEQIGNTIIPIMDKSEQIAIVTYLDEKCAAIDGVIAEKEALIGELESYKKSLIFETVTGKRRVC